MEYLYENRRDKYDSIVDYQRYNADVEYEKRRRIQEIVLDFDDRK